MTAAKLTLLLAITLTLSGCAVVWIPCVPGGVFKEPNVLCPWGKERAQVKEQPK